MSIVDKRLKGHLRVAGSISEKVSRTVCYKGRHNEQINMKNNPPALYRRGAMGLVFFGVREGGGKDSPVQDPSNRTAA